MAEINKPDKEKSLVERGSRFGRNFNIAVGSIALAGALIAPPVAAAGLTAYAGLNFIQAGGFEAARRIAKNRQKKRANKT
jgi:hypothetical protein